MTKQLVFLETKYSTRELLSGPVADVITNLQAIAEEFPDAEFGWDWDHGIELTGSRPETDAEYDKRVAAEASKQLKERNERKQKYEALKKEFEGA